MAMLYWCSVKLWDGGEHVFLMLVVGLSGCYSGYSTGLGKLRPKHGEPLVGFDGHRTSLATPSDGFVLCFHHGLVLSKRRGYVLVNGLGHLVVAQRKVAPMHPKIMGVVVVLRRQRRDVVKLNGALAGAVRLVTRTCASGGRA